jgi:hypothetical protein
MLRIGARQRCIARNRRLPSAAIKELPPILEQV